MKLLRASPPGTTRRSGRKGLGTRLQNAPAHSTRLAGRARARCSHPDFTCCAAFLNSERAFTHGRPLALLSRHISPLFTRRVPCTKPPTDHTERVFTIGQCWIWRHVASDFVRRVLALSPGRVAILWIDHKVRAPSGGSKRLLQLLSW